ncbi:MAG: hypothetical protein HOP19_07220 [Acidobacteria bacterium]|nr:hypothetical protein [Acidobacteriota bacterium]
MNRFAVMQSALSREATRSVLLVLLMALPAVAQNSQTPTDNSNAAQRTLRVARISLLEGDVNYQRGDDKNTDWFDATINTALEERDQLFSGRNGRAEMQLNGRTLVRLDRETNVRIAQFNTSTVQLSQAVGTATYRVDNLDRRQFQVYDVAQGSIDDPLHFEVDTPAVAITFTKEGLYRINVRDDGTTELIVRKGQAEIYNQELGTIQVKSGRRILIEGRDVGYYQIAKLNDKDEWDRWNDRREDDFNARVNDNRSSRYVPVSVAGSYDLDNYGDWYETPEYGYVWSPRGVNAGWAPYRSGAWRYHNTWGWTWTSYEPWGWAPYHYGRWNYYNSRWCWTPFVNFGVGRVGVGFWDWSPHLVAFFGSGGSYNRGYNNGYYDGYRDASWRGWCPLGIGERWGYGYYDRGGNWGRRNVYINNTYINNTTIVRNVDGLRNYGHPNGVGGMDGRRFDNRRINVDNNSLTPPPRELGRGTGGRQIAGNPNGGVNNNNQPVMEFARPEVFRPTQNEAGRALPVERNSPTARALNAPVIVRRNPADGEGRAIPSRSGNLDNGGAPIIRTGNNGDNGNREIPSRNNGDNNTPQVFNRPERRNSNVDNNGGFRPVERIERPTVTRPANEDRRATIPDRNSNNNNGGVFPDRNSNRGSTNNGDNNGNNSGGTIFSAPRERRMPRNDEGSNIPSRNTERNEQPRQIERREAPRMPERTESPRAPERIERSAPRDNIPSRAPERMERQAPPPRESAPAKPERSGGGERGSAVPSRKTDN